MFSRDSISPLCQAALAHEFIKCSLIIRVGFAIYLFFRYIDSHIKIPVIPLPLKNACGKLNISEHPCRTQRQGGKDKTPGGEETSTPENAKILRSEGPKGRRQQFN